MTPPAPAIPGVAALGIRDDDATALPPSDPVRHVAARLTHGPTPELVRQIAEMTPTGWIDAQLRPEEINDGPAELAVAGFTLLRLSPAAARKAKVDVDDLRREVRVSALLRAVHSPRQLFEVMVEFWRNHFSIDLQGHIEGLSSSHYEHDVLRPHALGRFSELLGAVAAAPAMLSYLDNADSRAPDVNENYARELLELHTLGIDAGYGEQDVRMAAAAFSGWGFDDDLVFVFRPGRHDPRALQVMDWRAPEGTSVERGQDLLTHLARHPATAHRLAAKLATWFIGPAPSPALVNRAAKAYLVADTDISALLRVLLHSDEFFGAPLAKVRQPMSQLAAWLRATDASTDTLTGASATGTKQLERALRDLGQLPLSWPTPDGPPDDDVAWSSAAGLLARWRLASRLLANAVSGVTVDHDRWSDGLATVGQLVDRLAAELLSLRLRPDQRAPLVAFGGGADVQLADLSEPQRQELCGLVLLVPDALRR